MERYGLVKKRLILATVVTLLKSFVIVFSLMSSSQTYNTNINENVGLYFLYVLMLVDFLCLVNRRVTFFLKCLIIIKCWPLPLGLSFKRCTQERDSF